MNNKLKEEAGSILEFKNAIELSGLDVDYNQLWIDIPATTIAVINMLSHKLEDKNYEALAGLQKYQEFVPEEAIKSYRNFCRGEASGLKLSIAMLIMAHNKNKI